jgi:hypothetical protein
MLVLLHMYLLFLYFKFIELEVVTGKFKASKPLSEYIGLSIVAFEHKESPGTYCIPRKS